VKRPKINHCQKENNNKKKKTHTHMHTHTYRHTDSTTRNPVKEKNWMQASHHTEISTRLFITKCGRHYERKQKERPEKSNHMARKRKKKKKKRKTKGSNLFEKSCYLHTTKILCFFLPPEIMRKKTRATEKAAKPEAAAAAAEEERRKPEASKESRIPERETTNLPQPL
jgi:hypothetical protein